MRGTDNFKVGSADAREVPASAESPAIIVNGTGGALFHKNAPDVDSGDSELANGASVTVEVPTWIISASATRVYVLHPERVRVEDVIATDDLTVGDDATIGGDLEVDGDLNHDGTKVGFFATAPAARPEVAKDEGETKKATAAELQEALETLGLIEQAA